MMYLGQVMDIGPADSLYAPPYHPYTEALLSAVPIPDPSVEQRRIRLEGNVPSAMRPPSGCRFHTRCPRRAMMPDGGKKCETDIPVWREFDNGHRVFCHLDEDTLMSFEEVISAPKTAA